MHLRRKRCNFFRVPRVLGGVSNNLNSMKLEILFSRLAAIGMVAATTGLAIDALPLACFAGATGALVLLVASADYSPRRRYDFARVHAARPRAALPLAA
jgi:hypothetical protein